MSVVDRLFGLCGFERRRQPLRELIVFDSMDAARQAGFKGQQHPQHPGLIAWWPGLGASGLMMRHVHRITLSRYAPRRTDEGSLRAILRSRQATFRESALWIEL